MSDWPGQRHYISQGEFAVGVDPGTVISTLLGSCVATCLWDPLARIGGMNHFLLPDGPGESGDKARFGAYAMELLINGILRAGGDRSRLRSKVFGGAMLRSGLTDAGQRNSLFVLDYLKREGIPCDAQSLGGARARQLEFAASEGRVRQRLVSDALPDPEAIRLPQFVPSGLELF